MSGYIDAEKFKQLLYDKGYVVNKYGDVNTSITTINCCIESAKVDAVEVVRCKDCKHYHCYHGTYAEPKQPWDCGACDVWDGLTTDENGYCPYGERKEE